MASSRLEKIGTIYSRVTGLLRAGAMKPDELPLWYSIYEAFPPKYEPRYDRPAAPDIPVRNIFYKEDALRAKFQKQNENLAATNMFDTQYKTQTQQFIAIYQRLEKEGTPEAELYEAAVKKSAEESQHFRNQRNEIDDEKTSIAAAFKAAKQEKIDINIKDIFKD